MEDLRGKTLATSGVGEFTDVGARLVLKKYGLAPEVDVKLRALFGNHPLRLSALQAGQIDGTIMSMPYNKIAVKVGFREIVHLREIIKTPPGRFGQHGAKNPQRPGRGSTRRQSGADRQSFLEGEQGRVYETISQRIRRSRCSGSELDP